MYKFAIMPKRRNAESASIERTSLSKKPASPAPVCMLHVLSISDHGPFTPLSRIKGTAFDKLKHLREIRDLRLCKPHASPYSMQSVCDQIHETVPKDLENNGYHRQCYQRFTGNLHLIENKTTEEPQASTSLLHSPRRHSTGPVFCQTCCNDWPLSHIHELHRHAHRPQNEGFRIH